MTVRPTSWFVVLGSLAVAACAPPTFEIDQYPIGVDLDAGVPLVLASSEGIDNSVAHPVIIDTASPITVLYNGSSTIARRLINIDVWRPGMDSVVRAEFLDVQAVLGPVGLVGEGAAFSLAGVIGADSLSRVAMRLDPANAQIRFFTDIAGSDEDHEDNCDADFPVTLVGGGMYSIGNDTTGLGANRIALGVCLAPDPPSCLYGAFPCNPGHDTVLLLSTSVGPTVLTRSAFESTTGLADADVDALPTTTLYLDGDTTARTVPMSSISSWALAAHEGDRGACGELINSRLEAIGGCTASANVPCPCFVGGSTDTTCTAGATVEMYQPIDVVIIEDSDPYLQGLRNELRPGVADIDGLLGWKALGPLVTDVDYPHSRVIFRCNDNGATCHQRPHIGDTVSDRVNVLTSVYGCLP